VVFFQFPKGEGGGAWFKCGEREPNVNSPFGLPKEGERAGRRQRAGHEKRKRGSRKEKDPKSQLNPNPINMMALAHCWIRRIFRLETGLRQD